MVEVVLAHTGQCEPAVLGVARALVQDAFDGSFTDSDWEHALGGLHALVWDGAELVAHGAVVQRRLLHRGRALRTGYVEGVAVRAHARRRGHGGVVMAALESVADRAYDLAALSTTEQGAPFYRGRGWLAWHGPTSALTPSGVVLTPEDDDAVLVRPTAAVAVDRSGQLTCDWRDGDLW
jgi:aminoglycoside 2'-N-acetyltransferase I